ncbi:hypothetical protein Taro_052123 [Colocasia esculenta]|uniref:Uncharacterized protein n=1 Tax=Colocasia esculenta TaxID=4460 RepID=A0A843XIS7_COLES|nr:hypothetical protein [Colocasia esculenta]
MGLQLCGLQCMVTIEAKQWYEIRVGLALSGERGAAMAFAGFLVAGPTRGPREEGVRSVGRLVMWCSSHFMGSSRW